MSYLLPVLVFVLTTFSTTLSYVVNDRQNVTCGAFETYTDCLNPCVPTCQFPHRRQCEFLVCQPGCYCNPGYIRDKSNGECVEISSCKNYCLPDQEYYECGSACAPTCQDLVPLCMTICQPGCFCKNGYIFDPATQSCSDACD